MSTDREIGLLEFEKRLAVLYVDYPLTYFKRIITEQLTENNMPCVLISEGDDEIYNFSQRDILGYPCQRQLEIIVEAWDSFDDLDIKVKTLIELVRYKALEPKNGLKAGVLSNGIFIRELKRTGPFNYDIPGFMGMRIHFLMTYIDLGPFA